MPKSQFIDPKEILARGEVKFPPIPQNAYDTPLEQERAALGDEALCLLWRDMTVIRAFEQMLHELKTKGAFNGVEHFYAGPAHLSIGQEAGAVGQAFYLRAEDFIFGSHRSHGELIAKAFSCIRHMSDAELQRVLETYNGGVTLRAMARAGLVQDSVKVTAEVFVLYALLCELLAKEAGFNRGLGGSMHAFCLPFGIFPNNAIVGGSADIATGAALYKRVNRKDGIVVANIGDGASTCGNVWEGMHIAAMDQYNSLWDEAHRGGLPVIYFFFNNQYSMGDQPRGETTGMRELVRMAAAVNPQGMHARRINGNDPLAVIDAMKQSLENIRSGEGPVLLDVLTYRFSGHSPSDPFTYRTAEETEAWRAHDPLTTYAEKLNRAGVMDAAYVDGVNEDIRHVLTAVCAAACDDAISGRLDLAKDPEAISRLMFSNARDRSADPTACDVLIPKEENPRVKALAGKYRGKLEKQGDVPKAKVFQLRDALFEALLDGFYKYPTMITYGEGVRDWGGAFAVYRGLMDSLPYHRLFNAPIAEGGIVGSAVGYAMAGGKAVVELMYCDFLGRAGDQVFNQLAKWQAMSAGMLRMNVVVRVSVGSKYGAQHSQDWTSLVAHVPGLKVVYPATPYDAKGLMNAALAGTDPVVFFESQKLYDMGEQFHAEGVPEGYYEVEIGQPDIKREGSDITILSVGATLYRALEAADILHDRYNLSAEVIDARSVVPFDYAPVLASVKKTGRLVVTGDMCERGSILCDFAKNVTELAFDDLDGPAAVVGARNWITPAYEFEQYFYPQPEWIASAVSEMLLPLEGNSKARDYCREARVIEHQKGV